MEKMLWLCIVKRSEYDYTRVVVSETPVGPGDIVLVAFGADKSLGRVTNILQTTAGSKLIAWLKEAGVVSAHKVKEVFKTSPYAGRIQQSQTPENDYD